MKCVMGLTNFVVKCELYHFFIVVCVIAGGLSTATLHASVSSWSSASISSEEDHESPVRENPITLEWVRNYMPFAMGSEQQELRIIAADGEVDDDDKLVVYFQEDESLDAAAGKSRLDVYICSVTLQARDTRAVGDRCCINFDTQKTRDTVPGFGGSSNARIPSLYKWVAIRVTPSVSVHVPSSYQSFWSSSFPRDIVGEPGAGLTLQQKLGDIGISDEILTHSVCSLISYCLGAQQGLYVPCARSSKGGFVPTGILPPLLLERIARSLFEPSLITQVVKLCRGDSISTWPDVLSTLCRKQFDMMGMMVYLYYQRGFLGTPEASAILKALERASAQFEEYESGRQRARDRVALAKPVAGVWPSGGEPRSPSALPVGWSSVRGVMTSRAAVKPVSSLEEPLLSSDEALAAI